MTRLRWPGGRVALRAASAGLLLGAWAWWAVGLAPFSASATAVVLAAGVAAMAWGARLPPRPRPTVSGRGATAWAALVAAAAAWQLAAYVQHPREEHPTISSLANALLDSRPARAAAFVAWLVAAAGLSRR